MRTLIRAAGLEACLTLALGCSAGPVRVAGKVVYDDGQPATDLSGGSVQFTAMDSQNSSSGDIQPDGSFVLSWRGRGDGAMPGTYKVAIQPLDPGWEGETVRRQKSPIPPEYSYHDRTPLTVAIERRTSDLVLTVPRNKPKK